MLFKNALKANNQTEILNALKKLKGETFKHLKQINTKLQKILKRTLSSEEIEFLKHKLLFKPQSDYFAPDSI